MQGATQGGRPHIGGGARTLTATHPVMSEEFTQNYNFYKQNK